MLSFIWFILPPVLVIILIIIMIRKHTFSRMFEKFKCLSKKTKIITIVSIFIVVATGASIGIYFSVVSNYITYSSFSSFVSDSYNIINRNASSSSINSTNNFNLKDYLDNFGEENIQYTGEYYDSLRYNGGINLLKKIIDKNGDLMFDRYYVHSVETNDEYLTYKFSINLYMHKNNNNEMQIEIYETSNTAKTHITMLFQKYVDGYEYKFQTFIASELNSEITGIAICEFAKKKNENNFAYINRASTTLNKNFNYYLNKDITIADTFEAFGVQETEIYSLDLEKMTLTNGTKEQSVTAINSAKKYISNKSYLSEQDLYNFRYYE